MSFFGSITAVLFKIQVSYSCLYGSSNIKLFYCSRDRFNAVLEKLRGGLRINSSQLRSHIP
jgi:hypothetical protein